MLIGIYRNLRSYGLGLTDVSSLISKDLGIKLRRFTKYGLGQRKVVQGGSGGVMHGALLDGMKKNSPN